MIATIDSRLYKDIAIVEYAGTVYTDCSLSKRMKKIAHLIRNVGCLSVGDIIICLRMVPFLRYTSPI